MAVPPLTPETYEANGLGTSWTTFKTVAQIDNVDTWIKPDLLTVTNTSNATVTFEGRIDPNSGDAALFARVDILPDSTVEIPVPNASTVGDKIEGKASAAGALDVAFSYYVVSL